MKLTTILLTVSLLSNQLLASPTITVSQTETLLDEPIAITISGMPPGELITVHASCKEDIHDQEWSSQAVFEMNEAGEVDLTTQAPIE